MSRESTCSILMALFVVSGCSFLQDWSEYRDGSETDAGGMDAGGVDAGDVDAGDVDAGGCSHCADEGCDPMDPVGCTIDPTDMCFHCEAIDGAPCDDDSMCDAPMVCVLGMCLFECNSRTECEAQPSMGDECVVSNGRGVCINHECDPVLGDCGAGELCGYAYPEGAPNDLATFCFAPTGPISARGDVCSLTTPFCESGSACVDIAGMGVGRCVGWCYVDASPSGCRTAERCTPIASPTGEGASYLGRALGVCVPTDCDTTTCPAGTGCVVGPMGPLCLLTCASDSECPSTGTCLPTGECIVECTTDSVCPPLGYSTCIPSRTDPTRRTCVADCPASNICPNGAACTDLNGDGVDECFL